MKHKLVSNKKRLQINKVTICGLNRSELADAKAGAVKEPCWENIWTLYHCDVMYTGDGTQVQAAAVAATADGCL